MKKCVRFGERSSRYLKSDSNSGRIKVYDFRIDYMFLWIDQGKREINAL